MAAHLLDSAPPGAASAWLPVGCGAEQEEALGAAAARNGLKRMVVFLLPGESLGQGAKRGSFLGFMQEGIQEGAVTKWKQVR